MADNGLPCDNCPYEMECEADNECRLTDIQLTYYSNIVVDCTKCVNSIKKQMTIINNNAVGPKFLGVTSTECSLKPSTCRFKLKTTDGSN